MLKDTTRNLFIGLARTATPIIVGFIASFFTSVGLDLSPEMQAQVAILVFGLTSYGYYAIVAILEKYVSPKWGWFLSVAKQPEYQKTLTDNAPTLLKRAETPEEGDKGVAG